MTQEGGAGGGGSGIQSITSPDASIAVGGTSADTTLEVASGSKQYMAEGWYWTVYDGIPVSNNAFSAGGVTFVPIDIGQPVTVEAVACLATGTFAAGSAMGLYSDVNGLPGALLTSAGVSGTGTIVFSPNYVTSKTVWIGLYVATSAVAIDSLTTATYPIPPSAPRYTFNTVTEGGASFSGAAFCRNMTGQTGLPATANTVNVAKLQFCPRYQVKILPS